MYGFRWRVLADGERRFVYSPRFGTTYLLDQAGVDNGLLLRLLGLPLASRVDEIVDPATCVGLGGQYEKAVPPDEVVGWAESESAELVQRLSRWYLSLHHHRWRYTPANMARWVVRVASSVAPDTLTLDRIGRLVALAEFRVGVSDCYPRSLLLGALCERAGIGHAITIGILAPTRKLHAWCTSGGTLIYEPTPRHWWYRPLADFRFGSARGA